MGRGAGGNAGGDAGGKGALESSRHKSEMEKKGKM